MSTTTTTAATSARAINHAAPALPIVQLGFGAVGQGFYDVAQHNSGLPVQVLRIGVHSQNKVRPLAPRLFSTDNAAVLGSPGSQAVVEAISDAAAAFAIAQQVLGQGGILVSANKKMLAENLQQVVQAERQHGGTLLYEAAVGGAIPILHLLDSYFAHEQLLSLQGILNGTTNYILTQQLTQGLGYDQALQQAQQLGYAEADPTLDVSGRDANNKLCILALHAYGAWLHPNAVLQWGISNISADDVAHAAQQGGAVKLIVSLRPTHTGRLWASVLPTLLPAQHRLAQVHDAFNALEVHGRFSGLHCWVGRGAGGHPTGAAMHSDLLRAVGGQRYQYAKLGSSAGWQLDVQHNLRVYLRARTLDHLAPLALTDVVQLPAAHDEVKLTATVGYAALQAQAAQLQRVGVSLLHLP